MGKRKEGKGNAKGGKGKGKRLPTMISKSRRLCSKEVHGVAIATFVSCCVDSTTKSGKWDTTRSLRYNQDSQREEGLFT